MEVKTQEVIRYIDLRFKEQDLKDLRSEIDRLDSFFRSSSYTSDKAMVEQMKKLFEFRKVVEHAIDELKS